MNPHDPKSGYRQYFPFFVRLQPHHDHTSKAYGLLCLNSEKAFQMHLKQGLSYCTYTTQKYEVLSSITNLTLQKISPLT